MKYLKQDLALNDIAQGRLFRYHTHAELTYGVQKGYIEGYQAKLDIS